MTLNRKPAGAIRPTTLNTSLTGGRNGTSSSQATSPGVISRVPLTTNGLVKGRPTRPIKGTPLLSPVSTPGTTKGSPLLSPTSPIIAKGSPFLSPASTPGTPPPVRSPTVARNGFPGKDATSAQTIDKSRKVSAVAKQKDPSNHKDPPVSLPRRPSSTGQAKMSSPTTRRISKSSDTDTNTKNESSSNLKDAKTSKLSVTVQKRKQSNGLVPGSNKFKRTSTGRMMKDCNGDLSSNCKGISGNGEVTAGEIKPQTLLFNGGRRSKPRKNSLDAGKQSKTELNNSTVNNQTRKPISKKRSRGTMGKEEKVTVSDDDGSAKQLTKVQKREEKHNSINPLLDGAFGDGSSSVIDLYLISTDCFESNDFNSINTDSFGTPSLEEAALEGLTCFASDSAPKLNGNCSVQQIVHETFDTGDEDILECNGSLAMMNITPSTSATCSPTNAEGGELSTFDELELAWDFDRSQFMIQRAQTGEESLLPEKPQLDKVDREPSLLCSTPAPKISDLCGLGGGGESEIEPSAKVTESDGREPSWEADSAASEATHAIDNYEDGDSPEKVKVCDTEEVIAIESLETPEPNITSASAGHCANTPGQVDSEKEYNSNTLEDSSSCSDELIESVVQMSLAEVTGSAVPVATVAEHMEHPKRDSADRPPEQSPHQNRPSEPVQQGTRGAAGLEIDGKEAVRGANLEGGDSAVTKETKSREGLPGFEVVNASVVDSSPEEERQLDRNSDQHDLKEQISEALEVSTSESSDDQTAIVDKIKQTPPAAVQLEGSTISKTPDKVIDEVIENLSHLIAKEPQSVCNELQMVEQTTECAAESRVVAEDLHLMIPLKEKESEQAIIDETGSCIKVQQNQYQVDAQKLSSSEDNTNISESNTVPPREDKEQVDPTKGDNAGTVPQQNTRDELKDTALDSSLVEVETTQDGESTLPCDSGREMILDGPASLSLTSATAESLVAGCALPELSGQLERRSCDAEPGTPRSLQGDHSYDNWLVAAGPEHHTDTAPVPEHDERNVDEGTAVTSDVMESATNVVNDGLVTISVINKDIEKDTAINVDNADICVESEKRLGFETDKVIDDVCMKSVDPVENISTEDGTHLESPVAAVIDNNNGGGAALHGNNDVSVTGGAAAQEDTIEVREENFDAVFVRNTETDNQNPSKTADGGRMGNEGIDLPAGTESIGDELTSTNIMNSDGIDSTMVDPGATVIASKNTTHISIVGDCDLAVQASIEIDLTNGASEIHPQLTKDDPGAGSGGRRERVVRQQRSRVQRQGSADAEQPHRRNSKVLVKSKSTSTLRIAPPVSTSLRPETVTEKPEGNATAGSVGAKRRTRNSGVQAVTQPPPRQVKRKLTPTDTGDKKRTAPGETRPAGSTVSNGGRGSEAPSTATAAGGTGPSSARGAASSTPQSAGPRSRGAGLTGEKSGGSTARSSRTDALKNAPPSTRRTSAITRTSEPVKTSRPSKGGPGALSAADTAELKRLEAELSAKSTEAEQAKKEADEAKSEATHAGRGLEALTVLVHHLTHQYEAFSNPVLKAEIARLQTCLQEAERALGESRVALEAAETRLSEERASAALQQLQIEEQHGTTLQRLQEEQEQHLQQIKDQHLKDMEDLAKEHQGDTLAEQEQHRAEVTRLEAEHERKLSEVCRVHGEEQQTLRRDLLALGDGQHQVSEVLATHATREQELQARSTSLQKEHDRLKEQSKKLQDSLLSDNDHRVTALKNYCTGLQQEVDSLKSVVEMRNSELHKLRAQVSGMEQLQRDLDAARQCANTLQAKTEDLNAQMDAKAKAERQLLSSNRQLLENMNRESTLNKQLRLENEQLQWKLRQREQLSTSLPLSTLDLMTRVCHLNTSWEERPASLHHQQHLLRESQQSAALGKGATRAESRLVTSSPQDDRSKQQQKDQTHQDKLKAQKRGDGESPPSSPCVKAVVEKSNSVSFILDLNDSLSDDSYLEFPASPRLKHGTPTFCRKAVQKSRSSSLDKKIGSQMGKNIALAKCTSAGNFFSKGPHSELEPIKDSKSESSKENGSFLSDNQLHEHSRRLHSTSESSGGADSETLESSIERVSPSGLAWTVPMNGTSPNSPRSPRHSSSRDNFTGIGLRHLQEPEEDEYEENLEDSEDAFINGIHPDITPLVNLMNASSSSPSDSELSRCGSQAGLTSESDEESSLAEGDRPADSLSPEAVWLPQVGAGESMVSSELVVQCGGSNSSTDSTGHSTKDTPTKDVQNKMALSTASFPNGEGAPQGRLEGEQKV